MKIMWLRRFCYLKNKIDDKITVIGISNLTETFGRTEFQVLCKVEIVYFPETGRFSHYYVKIFSRLISDMYSKRCPSNLAFFTQLESIRQQIH